MPLDQITMVYPGGATRCLFSSAPDYAFQVVPGDSDRLLIHFQGGGACWDDFSTNVIQPRPCVTTPKVQPLCGIFDRTRTENPFRQHTVVHIQYCSGDLHVGNATRWYLDDRGAAVEQRGYINARSAILWAKANLRTRLASLVLSGCSSGAVGAEFWAAEVLRQLEYAVAVVIADSYVGVLPEGVQGAFLKGMGACSTSLLQGALAVACEQGSLRIEDAFNAAMQQHPKAAFASINSKRDWSQIRFYNALAAQRMLSADLDAVHYLRELNLVFRHYNENANYVSYLVASDDDGFLPKPLLYNTSTHGSSGTGQPALVDWLTRFRSGSVVSSECSGRLLPENQWDGVGYCDAAQAHKAFVVGGIQTTSRVTTTTSSTPVAADVVDDGSGPAWALWYYCSLGVVAAALCAGAARESCQISRRHGTERGRTPRSPDNSAFLEDSG